MWKLVPVLVREMGQAYPELIRAEALITETLKLEETRFRKTLERGLVDPRRGDRKLAQAGDMLEGETAFTLYDTYGFPLDLTQDALQPRGIGVDTDRLQRRHGAPAREGARLAGPAPAKPRPTRSGSRCAKRSAPPIPRLRDRDRRRAWCRRLCATARKSTALKQGRERRRRAQPDAVLWRVRRPGRRHRHRCSADGVRLRVTDTQKKAGDVFVHTGTVEEGTLKVGAALALDGRSRAPHRTSAPTIRRRICCTRRCARCSAITSRRRARWSRPTGCASISRIPSRSTTAEIEQVEDIANDMVLQNSPVDDAADGGRRRASPPARARCSARNTATRCASSPWARVRPGNTPWAGRSSCAAARMCSAPATSG